LTRSLTASSSVSTGIGERVLREQRMSEMNKRLNDGSKVQELVKGSSVGSWSAKELVLSYLILGCVWSLAFFRIYRLSLSTMFRFYIMADQVLLE
jgi:hypothetical protein